MKNEPKDRGGYSYYPTEDMIECFSNLSTEQKLKWLDDVNRFLFAVANEKTKKRWDRLRKGGVVSLGEQGSISRILRRNSKPSKVK